MTRQEEARAKLCAVIVCWMKSSASRFRPDEWTKIVWDTKRFWFLRYSLTYIEGHVINSVGFKIFIGKDFDSNKHNVLA